MLYPSRLNSLNVCRVYGKDWMVFVRESSHTSEVQILRSGRNGTEYVVTLLVLEVHRRASNATDGENILLDYLTSRIDEHCAI